MRRLLTITVASLSLAGCAGNYGKLADAHPCEPSMPPSMAATSLMLLSNSVAVPARSLPGSGKLDNDDTMTYACIDGANNKNNRLQVPNPHKVRLDHLSSAT